MSKIRTIVVGTDFSPASRGALLVGTALARAHGARLVVAHALGALVYPSYARGGAMANVVAEVRARTIERLDRLARPIGRSGVDIETAAPEGLADVALLAAAQAEGADLLIVGTHGQTGLRRLTLASDAARLARSAPMPLLIVPRIPRDYAIRGVLIGTDFSECAGHALAVGMALTRPFAPEVTLAHAVDLGPLEGQGVSAPDMRERAEKRAATQLAKWKRASTVSRGRVPHAAVVSGPPEAAIAALAETRRADLVVLGSVGRRGWKGLVIGNTAERVLRGTRVPVLIVKPKGFRARS